MKVDTARSASYTRRIAAPSPAAQLKRAARLEPARRNASTSASTPRRRSPRPARYLALARKRFGREDLAFVSYHMGIGNLESVLRAYGQGRVPYAQLYFDSTPLRHAAAYKRLSCSATTPPTTTGSSARRWRSCGSPATTAQGSRRRRALQSAAPDARLVLHPPGTRAGERPAGAAERARRYRPARPARGEAAQGGARRGAVRRRARCARSPTIRRSVSPGAAAGWSFSIARDYASPRQALAFQYVLDRLQVLNVIAWSRDARTIHVTAANDAAALEPLLDRAEGDSS